MPVHKEGAQRASGHRSWRLVVVAVMASVMAIGGLATHPTPAARLQRLADLAFAGLPGVRPSWRT